MKGGAIIIDVHKIVRSVEQGRAAVQRHAWDRAEMEHKTAFSSVLGEVRRREACNYGRFRHGGRIGARILFPEAVANPVRASPSVRKLVLRRHPFVRAAHWFARR